MSDIYLETPQCFLGGTDCSLFVISVNFPYSRESLDNTKGAAVAAAGTRTSMNGLHVGSAEFVFAEDYTVTTGIDAILWTLSEAGASFAVRIRPSIAAISTSNPEYQFNAVFDGPYDLVSAEVGAHMRKTVRLALASVVTRDVTP